MPYEWRRMSDEQRSELLRYRQLNKRPWHSPPHVEREGTRHFHLTAACYEHKPHIGYSPERMQAFESALLEILPINPVAWCILPNHYHLLVLSDDLKATTKILGKLHGRSSFDWNREEERRGRKIWHGAPDRAMRSTRHFWTTLNYIHHNPVKHGYVEKQTDWPHSSVHGFLEEVGRERAVEIWKEFPVKDYGKGWDEF